VGTDSFAYEATAADGRSSAQTVEVAVAGPPSVSVTSPINGTNYYWQSIPRSDFSCAAGASGTLQSCNATVDKSPPFASGTALPDSIGTHTMIVTATDSDGQSTSQSVTYTSSLVVVPFVLVSSPVSHAKYTLGQVVKASYLCLPANSGPAITGCVCTVASDQAINTKTLGQKTFTATATDATGQAATVDVPYVVVPTTNHFTISRVSANRRGLLEIALALPGPGQISVVATGGAHTGSKHFIYAHLRTAAKRAGTQRITMKPNGHARALVSVAGVTSVVTLQITYTPTGGKPRRSGSRRVRIP
jgi:hypothetical protein